MERPPVCLRPPDVERPPVCLRLLLVLWLAWVVACAVIGLKPKKKEGVSRAVVLVASIVMSAAYVIPHSMGGSELDYSQVDAGVDPSKAIETGRQ